MTMAGGPEREGAGPGPRAPAADEPSRTALAAFSLALSAATTDLPSVLRTAATAIGETVGDGGVVCLMARDGVLQQSGCFHPDEHAMGLLQAALDLGLHSAVHGFGAVLAGVQGPMVLQPLTERWVRQTLEKPVQELIARLAPTAMMALPLHFEEQYLGFLGAFRTVADRPYTDDDVAVMTDIGNRVGLAVAAARSVQRLHESERRYRRIVETTGEGVWMVDAAGCTTFVNDRMAEILGVARGDLLARPARIFLDEAGQVAAVRRLRNRALGIGEQYEEQIIRPDGSRLDVHITATPLYDDAGHPAGSLSLVTDISHRVRAANLERQLEQVRRLDSLGQLAGGIAHDFNNLLLVMGGFGQVLQDRLEPESPLRPFTHQIISAAGKGAALTRQLLEFGRGDHGQGEVLDVGDVILNLEPMLRRTLGEHVELVVEALPGVSPVCIDRGKLEQVIVNLAANARDAMPGGGRVVIGSSAASLDGVDSDWDTDEVAYTRVTVSDTGQGMDHETRRRAFEPFFTTKERGKGTGLGLASVYGVIGAAGGRVSLHSEPGAGTTVKVLLPAVPAGVVSAPEEPVRAADPAPAHILAVEDEDEVAELLKLLLESAGMTVTVVTEPTQALARFHRGDRVDLLITDVIMPQMTGPELVDVLHAAHPDLPVLYMSGYTAGMLGERGQVAPGTELIEKPFTRGVLLAAVTRALGSHAASTPASA